MCHVYTKIDTTHHEYILCNQKACCVQICKAAYSLHHGGLEKANCLHQLGALASNTGQKKCTCAGRNLLVKSKWQRHIVTCVWRESWSWHLCGGQTLSRQAVLQLASWSQEGHDLMGVKDIRALSVTSLSAPQVYLAASGQALRQVDHSGCTGEGRGALPYTGAPIHIFISPPQTL